MKISADPLKDIELLHRLSVFETHVYGVVSQYNRIQKSINIRRDGGDMHPPRPCSSCQVELDIYYYTLTWDKLKEIFKKFSALMNDIRKSSDLIPVNFREEYKSLQTRINNLFTEFDKDVRNEYEHPSLKPRKTGNIIEWGSLYICPNGDIRALIGEAKFSVVKKDHIERLINLLILLIDLFITSFSNKRPSAELIQLKKQIEENIDSVVEEYLHHRQNRRDKEANELLHQMTMLDIYLSREGMSLSPGVMGKLYSAIWGKVNSH